MSGVRNVSDSIAHNIRTPLARVLANLVDNALKFTESGARIQIKTKRQADRAILTVTDSGHGVGSEHLNQLGTRFFRLEPEVPGSGLGLASVLETVSITGGALRFAAAQPRLRVPHEPPLTRSEKPRSR